VIARNDSPDIPFDRSINPYRGCEHGCIYCFARPTHAWLGLSPGLAFETKLLAKHDAAALLRRELAKPGYMPAPLALGTNTDPYQPIERRLGITRRVLEVLAETGHPATIVTKSNLILRDLDILSDMAERSLVKVALSVTSLDRGLARTMEPRAPTPLRRLEAIEALASAGVPVGVMTAPIIPAINDGEMEAVLEAAGERGANEAGYILLRLPLEIKELFEEWLEQHFPDRKARVLSLIRETRGGALYDSAWGKRMKGEGRYAKLLADRFKLACRRFGLDRPEASLATELFKRPPKDPRQLDLL
jgi:DNA repair photolyase